jgi:histidine ammonia-lyase
MKIFIVDNQWVSIDEVTQIIDEDFHLELGENAIKAIANCRDFLDRKMESQNEIIYGVNTGFGSLCDTVVSPEHLEQLQVNLVRSHACGIGAEVPHFLVKRMLLLKILSLSHGNSGVQLQTVERLIYFFNNNILPVVFEQGSLGASGDLAPLAHLSLPLIGEGEVRYNGNTYQTHELYQKLGLQAIRLKSKEGLALLNGTQFMGAYLSYAVSEANNMWRKWNSIAALSIDAFHGKLDPFHENVNAIRKQMGQIEAASEIKNILRDSSICNSPKQHVQDPYAFRCIPQVHGASKDTIDYACQIAEREINAVTDNPTIFPEEDMVLSAGNFHGQPLALVMDFLAIALAELGSISERRVYKLISGTRGLPPFLVANPGLNSGFMIPQYAAASVVSQNKQLCTPASIDSIDSSNGQEDHVSMGANAATKLYRILENCYSIMAIELLNAAQAFQFRRPAKTAPVLESMLSKYRDQVPFVENDTYLQPLIKKSINFVKTNNFQDVR